MAELANINPIVLKWARETAKMNEEEASSKVSVKPEKLSAWEAGVSQPTIHQALKLAKAYQRPFAILFLPEPPTDFHPLQDFRKYGSIELSTSATFIIREIQRKQVWVSDEIMDSGEPPLNFVGRFSIKDSPKSVAADILATLRINPSKYDGNDPIRVWIDCAESEGIFVSRTSFIHSRMKLDKNEFQGFAIADRFAPFVFINSADWRAPQLFTLVHELAHIWIARTGISNVIDPEIKDTSQFHPVELFCNEVAANALIPEKFISELPSGVFRSSNEIFKVAKQLGVSSFAFLVRALKLKLVSLPEYQVLKNESEKEFLLFAKREAERKINQKKEKGGPSPYLLRLNRNSRLFTQIVLDGYKGGRIEPNLASNLLNVKSNKFHKLEERMYL